MSIAFDENGCCIEDQQEVDALIQKHCGSPKTFRQRELERMTKYALSHDCIESAEIVGNELRIGSLATCGNYADYGQLVCVVDYVTTWEQLKAVLGY
jgi:hypothetical protein